MMTKLEALTALRDKVKAGTLDDGRPFVGEVFIRRDRLGLDYHGVWLEKAYNGSLDAARELHEAVLPAVNQYMLDEGPSGCGCYLVIWPDELFGGIQLEFIGYADTPARAWLLAIIDALIAMEQD